MDDDERSRRRVECGVDRARWEWKALDGDNYQGIDRSSMARWRRGRLVFILVGWV